MNKKLSTGLKSLFNLFSIPKVYQKYLYLVFPNNKTPTYWGILVTPPGLEPRTKP